MLIEGMRDPIESKLKIWRPRNSKINLSDTRVPLIPQVCASMGKMYDEVPWSWEALHEKKVTWDWRDDSAVKSTCSDREPELGSKHIDQLVTIINTSSRVSDALF